MKFKRKTNRNAKRMVKVIQHIQYRNVEGNDIKRVNTKKLIKL